MRKNPLGVTLLFAALAVLAGGGCSSSSSGLAGGAPATIPLITDVPPIYGSPPAAGQGGPGITALDSTPGLDIVEQGGQFTLIFTSDMAGGNTISGVVLMIDGDNKYFLLDPVVAGNVASVTFTINPDFPDGDYPLLLGLIGPDGNAGNYVRAILHVAFVPSLEVVELLPLATFTIPPNGRSEEELNVLGRVSFTKPVATGDFTLAFEDMQGDTIPGIVTIMPGSFSASYRPLLLLDPDSQYVVTAQLAEGTSWSNAFWTQSVTPLGSDTAGLLPGRTYSIALAADNIVEPPAAQLIFSLIGSAIPPFLVMITDTDAGAGTFSALGTVAEADVTPLMQDTDIPVAHFAQDAQFSDPYFMTDPADISLATSVAGYDISLTIHAFTMSGMFSPDRTRIENGKATLYFVGEELRSVAEGFGGGAIPPGVSVCDALAQVVGPVCTDDGRIVVEAENLEGTYEPSVTVLNDLVPLTPATGDTVKANTAVSLAVTGRMEQNGQPLPPQSPGWTIVASATFGGAGVGTISSPVNVLADGTFSTQLDIGTGVPDSSKPLLIHLTCPQMPADDPWERTITITVVN